MASLVSKAERRKSISAVTREDVVKVKTLSQQPYKDQASKFLDLFWNANPAVPVHFSESEELREQVWKFKNMFVKLDALGEAGNELDEFKSHRALEQTDHALSVQEMRKVFAEADADHNHKLSLMEFLLFQYEIDWKYMTADGLTEGDSKVQQAASKCAAAQEQLQLAIAAAEAAQIANQKAKDDEASSVIKEAAAKSAEEEVQQAQEAQIALVQHVEAEEAKFAAELQALTIKSEDESLGVVTRNKAKAEVAQLKQTDPMPIRKAKINVESGLRRVTKALKVASAEKEQAIVARQQAVESVALAEAAVTSSEASRVEADKSFTEAQEFLEFVKANSTGCDAGSIWWMNRELEEAMKYMPKSKIAKLAASQATSPKGTPTKSDA